MVVDDEPDQIFTVKTILDNFSNEYEIIGANSGSDCLKLLKNNQIPDLILLDIMMPKMSGWEVYSCLKENSSWKNIPIVFITARNDIVAKKAGGFLGHDYIEKPYKEKELIKRIYIILNSK